MSNSILELKWGAQTPIIYNDPKYGEIELNAYGTCQYAVNMNQYNQEEIENMLTTNIVNSITEILSNQNAGYNQVIQSIQDNLPSVLVPKFQNSFIAIQDIKLTSIAPTDLSNQKIKEQIQQEIEKRKNTPTIIQTDTGNKDGQNKCPQCGATEISLNVNTGKLKCRFCRHEFEPEKLTEMNTDISQLQGQVMGSGATDIVADTNDMVTFKCSSCGAEVVIDTAASAQARCHWCRNTLSVNQQIPNGSIPDVVLPFGIKKEDAKAEIEKFVGKRKFFANPKFKKEFTTENIMGVYFPYMLVDVNTHASFAGQGEKLVRTYTRGSGDTKRTYYDADLYEVTRDFDLTINGLTVESSADKLNNNQSDKTNNVINAIMPFDIENCVKWNANYIKGFTSEKRDTNVDELRPLVDTQSKDIARFSANNTLQEYNRGVAWSQEQLTVKGQQWKAAYLPVWLYSYQQVNGDKKVLHYVAVNARTKETMGSVPIHMPKLLLFSFLVEILGFFGMISIESDYSWLFLSSGIIFFIIMFLRYRNSNARHKHELETKTNMSSVTGTDRFIQHRTGLRNARMEGANNQSVSGQNVTNQVFNALSSENLSNTVMNAITDNNAVANMIKNGIDNNSNNKQ